MESNNPLIPHRQCHGCWWTDDASGNGIELVHYHIDHHFTRYIPWFSTLSRTFKTSENVSFTHMFINLLWHWTNIGQGDGFLPGRNKPLPEPIYWIIIPNRSCGIHLGAFSQAVLMMNWIRNMRLEVTLLELQPHLSGTNELNVPFNKLDKRCLAEFIHTQKSGHCWGNRQFIWIRINSGVLRRSAVFIKVIWSMKTKSSIAKEIVRKLISPCGQHSLLAVGHFVGSLTVGQLCIQMRVYFKV